MNYISQQSLRAYVIAYLFAAAQSDRAGRDVEEIEKSLKKSPGNRRIQLAIDSLISDEIAEDIGSGNFYEYALTAEGYDTAEKSYLSEQSDGFKRTVDLLVERLTSSEVDREGVIVSESSVPASDRFVELGHNTPGYQETVEAVESALDSIRQSNSLDPEDRPWIQSNLTIGLGALKKGGRLLVEGLRAFTIEPLKAALSSVGEEKLKVAISLAISALKKYFGF
ncbi:hypothetical protein [Sphingobium nicotianae]|uniref:Uncharacterized protein n=1 Tax=Sphingobium nicotianae TaxID=2782607 RepID=A0A9X1DD44_9SPHN|nr:hypothetical protein [Sphingobium nicotianae]MBT2187716.1 hypothetical protein [Sphingobium nicotianae]